MRPVSSVEPPLVSIGVPVRNGARTLALALDALVGQTYRNLEIVISDNQSDDDTPAICRRFAGADARIRYVRQPATLSGFENFRYVFEQSRGEFFLWAADDDLRELNYVEVLLNGMRTRPHCMLMITDIYEFHDHGNPQAAKPMPRADLEAARSLLRGLYVALCLSATHIYGMLRMSALQGAFWSGSDYGPDRPLLAYLAALGPFGYVPGSRLYYWVPAVRKSPQDYALSLTRRRLRPLPYVRLAWHCAAGVRNAMRARGRFGARAAWFAVCYALLLWPRVRPRLYAWSPAWVRRAWRRIKARGLEA